MTKSIGKVCNACAIIPVVREGSHYEWFLSVKSHIHETVGKIQEGGVGHSQQAVRRMSRLAEVRDLAYTVV